jgi:hypothetical protein
LPSKDEDSSEHSSPDGKHCIIAWWLIDSLNKKDHFC